MPDYDEKSAAAALAAVVSDAALHPVTSLERVAKCLRVACVRPKGLLRWLAATAHKEGIPLVLAHECALLVGREQWEEEGAAVVAECARLASSSVAADCAVLSWAVQCGFATELVTLEAFAALRVVLPTLERDQDLVGAMQLLAQWLVAVSPRADSGIVALLHQVANQHMSLSSSRNWCAQTVSLLARSLTAYSPLLSPTQRVQMIAFPKTLWLAAPVWGPLVTTASRLDLEATAANVLPELLVYCEWNASDKAVIVARMAASVKLRLGEKVWAALLPCLHNASLLGMTRPLFQDMSQFDGQAWREFKCCDSVGPKEWKALLKACLEGSLKAESEDCSNVLVGLIGTCHIQLGADSDHAEAQCLDVLNNSKKLAVAMSDKELSDAFSLLGSATEGTAIVQLFASCRFGYLLSDAESSDAPSGRWMAWLGHALATQLIARKLRLMASYPTPQALFGQLARMLAAIAAGERPTAARTSALVLCLMVERLETAMRLAVLGEDKFFVANQKVCEDFFSRIRGVLIGALSHLGAFAEATQQWLFRLGEVREAAKGDASKVAELVGSVCAAASAAAEQGFEQPTDAIVAFGKGVEVEFDVRLPFLDALSLMARRKLEDAARRLRDCLATCTTTAETHFLVSQINLCYLMLGSTSQSHDWLRCVPEMPADVAKKTRLTALQQQMLDPLALLGRSVALVEGASAVQMATWAVEKVSAAASAVRQLVSVEPSVANLNLCALFAVSQFGTSVLPSHSGASPKMASLWGLLGRVNCRPPFAVADFLAGANVRAAIDAAGLMCNPKLLMLQNCVQNGFAIDLTTALGVAVGSVEEEGLKASLVLRAIDKKLVTGKAALPTREELLMRVSDSRVLGLYLTNQVYVQAKAASFDLPLLFRDALTKWLHDSRIPPAKGGMAQIAKACLTHAFLCNSEAGPKSVAQQLAASFSVAGESALQLETLLRDLKEHVVDRAARSALAALSACLMASPVADVEVALSLLRVLESTGCSHMFLVIVRPVFGHASWMQIVPQLLARIALSQCGAAVMDLLQTAANDSGNAQALFWSVRTACDGASWKAEQREQASVLLGWLLIKHPQLCEGCTQLYEGLLSLGALWEERWHRALKGIVSTLRRTSSSRSLVVQQEAVYSLFEETIERGPQSPHELWFARSMSGPLRHVVALLKSGASTKALTEPLEEVLAEVARMCDVSLTVLLSDISPTLANWSGSDVRVFIPGSTVLLHSFGLKVNAMRTKTRPKRLVAVGADGTAQQLLIKHGEDLRLDERLMQVFKLAKQWHYDIVPLGPSCGVIHIVDGLVSLYDLFRKHQPQDDFYSKLRARLQSNKKHHKWLAEAKNARDIEHHRSEWGGEKAILLDVYRELCKANPSDLLQKELWLNAQSAVDWLKRVDNFTLSTANISMLGYVLGLGDRHLDNVLFDQQSGRLLHIDLNVCFEGGKHLKVPETVPFRLTQNIRGGMRYGSVEGAFVELCTERLEMLRGKASVILMLLEAFVLDEVKGDVRKRKHEPGSAIVKRVEQKLAGSDYGRADMTAREQAQAAIAAAVSEDNLAQMYAGWGASW